MIYAPLFHSVYIDPLQTLYTERLLALRLFHRNLSHLFLTFSVPNLFPCLASSREYVIWGGWSVFFVFDVHRIGLRSVDKCKPIIIIFIGCSSNLILTHNKLSFVLDKYYTGIPHGHLRSCNRMNDLPHWIIRVTFNSSLYFARDSDWIRHLPTSTTSSRPAKKCLVRRTKTQFDA